MKTFKTSVMHGHFYLFFSLLVCGVYSDQVTLFDDINFGGSSTTVTYSRCQNLYTGSYNFNDRASSVKTGRCVRIWEHSCCQGRSLMLTQDTADFVALDFNDLATSVSPCGDYRPSAPNTLQETWLGHTQTIHKAYDNRDITVYYNDGIDQSITWPFEYLTKLWNYTKATYGPFGPEGSHLNPVFHGSVRGPQYGFNSLQTYFDSNSDCRNLIDLVSDSRNGWASNTGTNVDVMTHEVSHIVELASKGCQGSPTYPLWGDSKWAEIFIYDVYIALGMTAEKDRWYNQMQNSKDNYPKSDTYWFRDWFYPIYSKYGGKKLLNNYFDLLARYFQKKENKYEYDGDINMGEFVHFYSGAAGKSLKSQATKAFSWTSEYESQYQAARQKYPQIKYT